MPAYLVKACEFCDLNLSFLVDSRRRSNFLMPTIFRMSITKLDLILKSSGESVAKLELRLTSKIQGFKSESIKISKPRSSKQF